MTSSINHASSNRVVHQVPVDSNRNQILAARTFMTRQVTLANTNRLEITVPLGAYEAIVSSNTAVNVSEASATYVENGLTYGTGVSGTLVTVPCESQSFWISGTANQVVDIMFPTLRG